MTNELSDKQLHEAHALCVEILGCIEKKMKTLPSGAILLTLQLATARYLKETSPPSQN